MLSKKMDRIAQRVSRVSKGLLSGGDPREAARDLDAISVDLIAERDRVEGLEETACLEPQPGRDAAEGA